MIGDFMPMIVCMACLLFVCALIYYFCGDAIVDDLRRARFGGLLDQKKEKEDPVDKLIEEINRINAGSDEEGDGK